MYQPTLQAVKKDTWLMLAAAASLVIAIASLVLVARTRAELRQSITTHSLIVITPQGRIRLGPLPGNAVGLRIYSTAGKERLGLGVAPRKTAGFSLYDANGRVRAYLVFSDKSGRTELKIVR